MFNNFIKPKTTLYVSIALCLLWQIKEEFRRRGLASRAQFAEALELQDEFQEVFAEQMVRTLCCLMVRS